VAVLAERIKKDEEKITKRKRTLREAGGKINTIC
jgi:hypothetical protein